MRRFNPVRIKEKYDDLSRSMRSKGVDCVMPDGDGDFILMRRRETADDGTSLKAMIRERGTFVLLRLPNHVYRILPGRDVSDVCLAVLTRVAEVVSDATIAPVFGLVPEPDWLRDERVETEAKYARLGWRALPDDEATAAWSGFDRLASASDGRGQDPVPSVVWDISAVYSESAREDTEPDLTKKVLDALRSCTTRGSTWFVFSDFANVVSFDPWQMDDEVYRSSWMYPVLPRGDHPHLNRRTNHSCFVSSDFQQGILTYLHEDSLCVFGQDLLMAIESRRPTTLKTRRRQK